MSDSQLVSAGAGRRRFLKAAAATAVALPHVRTAHAAGKLSVGFWDHWVPGANEALAKLCNEWAAREKVDLKIDFITSQGNKLLLTVAAEAQAKSGHDMLSLALWLPAEHAENLEPVDDLVPQLAAQNGKVMPIIEYLAKPDGHWLATPATAGTQMKPPCGRLDLFKQHVGLDLAKMYPAGAPPDKALADQWTWDAFLSAAQKCHKAGYPFGLPLGQSADSTDWVGTLFVSYGAQLIDAKGNITVQSDATKQALEYAKKLVAYLPGDVFAWDDASNNKWLISGKGALIINPPSAWAVAKRDNPKVAEQCWTFPYPRGPKGRYHAGLPYYWGIWRFSKNKAAAKSLLAYLSQPAAVEQLVNASNGYDIPPFTGLHNFKVWEEAGPPKGTVFNYPPKADQVVWIAGSPAPPKIANQIYTQAIMPKMVAKFTQGGESLDKVLSWAASELEGYMRA